ncbi:MAG: type IV pilus twitching motility protein PilT [Patescibacteria group bacterium]|nr:type IV pilus twitching motility protein PilT [Patescibacteria group bacterium]
MATITKSQIDKLFRIAAEKKASDLHLLAGQPPILRISGVLAPIEKEKPLSSKEIFDLISSITTEEQLNKYERERELDFAYEIEGISRFRVNAHWERNNAGMVARVLSLDIPTMEDVLMPEVVYNLARMKQGLIVVTGPTGSGKSTSLAAIIDFINKERNEHIVTLEDPIEYVHNPIQSYIRQRQLGTDFIFFSEGLKRVVRQDPDVILVGEMRDLETIAAALTIAETGHLVFATLHTNGAAQTIDRIIDVFPPHQQEQIKLQLSMELRAVISQVLIPKINGGVIAAREIMINTPAVANLIRENKVPQLKSVIQTSSKEGMMSLDQNLKDLYKNKLISKETALSYMTSDTKL